MIVFGAIEMRTVIIRFYEELNDFLPENRRRKDFEVTVDGGRSVKDMLADLGVPHEQIDLILANGRSVGFDYVLADGDRLSVYPVFESFNLNGITRLRQIPLRRIRFIAADDTGDIAEHLRLMGFDIIFDPSLSEREVIEISNRDKRIFITKSRKLLDSSGVTRGLFIRSDTLDRQLESIIDRLDIADIHLRQEDTT